jgi:hypothetical protein
MPPDTCLVKRPLTAGEIDAVLTAVDAAGSAVEAVEAAMRATFNALLADRGETLAHYTAERPLHPDHYAIPTSQWKAITAAVINRVDEWGASAVVTLDLVNVMPSSYDDPDVPAPQFAKVDRRPPILELRITREATDVIADCEARVEALGDCYGRQSDIYLTALRSWRRQLARLFSMSAGAQSHIAKDGDLSLVVRTSSGLVYGIVHRSVPRTCAADGCGARMGADGAVCSRPGATALDHAHTPTYPLDAPTPGEWSAHS